MLDGHVHVLFIANQRNKRRLWVSENKVCSTFLIATAVEFIYNSFFHFWPIFSATDPLSISATISYKLWFVYICVRMANIAWNLMCVYTIFVYLGSFHSIHDIKLRLCSAFEMCKQRSQSHTKQSINDKFSLIFIWSFFCTTTIFLSLLAISFHMFHGQLNFMRLECVGGFQHSIPYSNNRGNPSQIAIYNPIYVILKIEAV